MDQMDTLVTVVLVFSVFPAVNTVYEVTDFLRVA